MPLPTAPLLRNQSAHDRRPSGPVFSVRDIPFSYHGSWFDFSPVMAEKTYAEDLHLVSHQTGMHAVLRLSPSADGRPGRRPRHGHTGQLTWSRDDGRIDLAYETADTVRLRGARPRAAPLAADPDPDPVQRPVLLPATRWTDRHVFTVYETGRRYRVTVLSGQAERGRRPGARHRRTRPRPAAATAVGDRHRGVRRPPAPPTAPSAPFERGRRGGAGRVRRVRRRGRALAQRPARPPPSSPPTCCGRPPSRPAGFVTRPAVLMSKHWMDKVWSWDHCFNALALADGLPELAWHQFQLPFDHQDAAGALPDSVTHSEVLYNFVKPPIHGWALRRLAAAAAAARPRPTGRDLPSGWNRWTDFWLDRPARPRPAAAALPARQRQRLGQRHHLRPRTGRRDRRPGRVPRPAAPRTRPPGRRLGRPRRGRAWTEHADRIADALLAELWDGGRFVARGAHSGADLDQLQPARPHADRARRPTCPRAVRDGARRPASKRT